MASPLASIIEADALRILGDVDLSSLAGKSVLITGASGLLGTYFLATLRELCRRGQGPAKVVATVYSQPQLPTTLVSDFAQVSLVQGDLTQWDFASALGRFDFVMHGAGYGQPGKFMEDQVKTLKLNTMASMALLDNLADGGRFLFISTSEVYSGLPNPPYHEAQIGTTNTTHARSCYIEAKRCGEAICNAYSARGVSARSARLALAYGPGTKPGDKRVINAFIERALSQSVLKLQDSGEAKRTYCYVSDAIEILWHILLRGTQPLYNVGGQSRTTVADLAKEVGRIAAVPVEFPQSAQALQGAPEDVALDMDRVQNEFGKRQYISFEQGLRQTIEWQRALYPAKPARSMQA